MLSSGKPPLSTFGSSSIVPESGKSLQAALFASENLELLSSPIRDILLHPRPKIEDVRGSGMDISVCPRSNQTKDSRNKSLYPLANRGRLSSLSGLYLLLPTSLKKWVEEVEKYMNRLIRIVTIPEILHGLVLGSNSRDYILDQTSIIQRFSS
mmetsp:Transcript_16956/g.35183  ORF Transcript_16956/g.35183 Transcript_16956/m.35183 type:complete len:153 (-) Transcript_16956:1781-2239(-)